MLRLIHIKLTYVSGAGHPPQFFQTAQAGLALDSGKLAGAIFVGEFKNEGFYLNLMQRKLDVAHCADTLLQGTFSYPRFLALGMNGNLGIKRLMGKVERRVLRQSAS